VHTKIISNILKKRYEIGKNRKEIAKARSLKLREKVMAYVERRMMTCGE
jgi:hypothetical protein